MIGHVVDNDLARKKRYGCISLLLFFSASLLFMACTPPAPLQGTWSGTFQTSLTAFPMTARVNIREDWSYSGTASSLNLLFFNFYGTINTGAKTGMLFASYMRPGDTLPTSINTTLLLGNSSSTFDQIIGTGYTSDLGNFTITVSKN
jgi:hypothetical protein